MVSVVNRRALRATPVSRILKVSKILYDDDSDGDGFEL